TVTYPDCKNPDEVKETCDYIRFLNRSTGKVRTGIGAGREDVNVSCRGGARVEIKGVAHTKWIPELTHVESFRQWALLHIREELKKRIKDTRKWKIQSKQLEYDDYDITHPAIKIAKKEGYKLFAVRLGGFKGMLSHFTQPGKMFADEISDRLKVIACIEKPNMVHSEMMEPAFSDADMAKLGEKVDWDEDKDALVIFWGPDDDIKTALETIEERCRMAFDGVPNETRKSFENGTTMFERVLPGADRMYPDTDSAPIPLESEYIENLRQNLPVDVSDRIKQFRKWHIPEDTFHYILKRNLSELIDNIVNNLGYKASFVGTFLGHYLKYIEGHHKKAAEFDFD
ncbi:MAG: hypothetical protein ACP5DZ_08445, partial [Bacteroidales bacterium]